MSAQSSNSLGTPRRSYDVFLNFRGEDVRGNFLEHLFRALRQKGILTFKDDNRLRDGGIIKDGLLKAIEESSFSIVVLSKNYANSSWCLTELVHILECNKTSEHVVYPIFFHVTPSEVRKQEGPFRKGFAKLFWENTESKQWRKALEEVGGIKGWPYPSPRFENEAKLIDELVHKIFEESIKTYHNFAEDLVGIRPRMVEVIKLLDLGSEKPRVVGLWGMGGIGKTTLAKAVYEAISWQFEGCSLIEDVRETSKRSGALAIQKQLISDILMEREVSNSMSAMKIIRNMVCRKKVLIVLDDVDESIELESLVGKLQWYSRGSRLIITTQNTHILTVYGAQDQDVFNVQELNNNEALQLFISKAFVENGQTGEFQTLIDRAVKYADGNPLALRILGSFLLGGTIPEWESTLDRLRDNPDNRLQQILIICYDGLHWTEKEIFLDIACYLIGNDRDLVTKVLDGCGFNAVTGINVLVKKSLLRLSVNDKLQMHSLIQKMGRFIVDEESRKDPGERSRLWRAIEVQGVITQNTGTKKVEGISFRPGNIQPRPDAFANMINLRLLWIHGAWCSIDLSNKLRLLFWNRCPLKCMPSTFQPEHLVELELVNSSIDELWDRTMVLPKLIVLILNNSTSLIKCPDFSGFPALENLELEGCTALLDLHPSITKLKRLTRLNMKDCISLQNLPYSFETQCLKVLSFSGCLKLTFTLESFKHLERLSWLMLRKTGTIDLHHSIGNCTDLLSLNLSECKQLRSIPRSIGLLKKLKKLFLQGSSSLSILPEEVGLIDSLELLDVSKSGLSKLPDSLKCLRNLQKLECLGYTGTAPCFSGFESLQYLNLSYCRLTSFPETISFCMLLKDLLLAESNFEYLPESIKSLCNLEVLIVIDCMRLQELPELPPSIRAVHASGCESLRTIGCSNAYKDARVLMFTSCSKLVGNEEISAIMGYKFLFNQIKENNHQSIRIYGARGCKIPKWITNRNVGGLVKLNLPTLEESKASNLLGFAFSAVVASKGQECNISVHMGNGRKIYYTNARFSFPSDSEDVIVLFYPQTYFTVFELNDIAGTVLEICFATTEFDRKVGLYESDERLEPAPQVKECGVCLIYGEETGSSLGP